MCESGSTSGPVTDLESGDRNLCSCADADPYAYFHTHKRLHTDSDAHADNYAYVHTHTDICEHRYAYSYADTDLNAYENTHTDICEHRYAYSYTDTDFNAYENTHTDTNLPAGFFKIWIRVSRHVLGITDIRG